MRIFLAEFIGLQRAYNLGFNVLKEENYISFIYIFLTLKTLLYIYSWHDPLFCLSRPHFAQACHGLTRLRERKQASGGWLGLHFQVYPPPCCSFVCAVKENFKEISWTWFVSLTFIRPSFIQVGPVRFAPGGRAWLSVCPSILQAGNI